jgi:quinol monooxygenase YgiN
MHKIDDIQVVCVAEFHAFEGKTEALIAALHCLIKPTCEEPGCLRYELNQSAEDPRCITFIEKWKNKEAFDAHCATPYIKDYFDNARPALVEDFKVTLYHEFLP